MAKKGILHIPRRRTTTRNRMLWTLMGAALLAVLLTVMPTPSAKANGDGDLPGTYNVDVCVHLSDVPICDPSGATFVGFFRAMITFNSDGTMIETDNFPGALDGSFAFSEGHGNWRETDDNRFVATFHKVHRAAPPAVDNDFERVLLRFRGNGKRVGGRFVLPPSPSFPTGIAGTFAGPRVAVESF